jgi:hypothetical protein
VVDDPRASARGTFVLFCFIVVVVGDECLGYLSSRFPLRLLSFFSRRCRPRRSLESSWLSAGSVSLSLSLSSALVNEERLIVICKVVAVIHAAHLVTVFYRQSRLLIR